MGNEIRDNDPGNVFHPIYCMPYTFSSVFNVCNTLYLIYVPIYIPPKNANVSATHTEKPEGAA